MTITADQSPTARHVSAPFLNPTFGPDMAQDASFSGTPILIHDGADNVGYTAAADLGAWTFNDATKAYDGAASIYIDANDGDQATFTGSSVDGSNYAAISMAVFLDRYVMEWNSIKIGAVNLGSPVGVEVDLNNYLDSELIGVWQKTHVDLVDLGVEASTFDGILIRVERTIGATPKVSFDVINIQETAGQLEYTLTPAPNTDYRINTIAFTLRNDVIGDEALNLSKLLGVTITEGFTINRASRGVSQVSRRFRDSYDFYESGINQKLSFSNGFESILVMEIEFTVPVLLESDFGDTISFVLNDDLSGLTRFTALARGGEEDI